MRVPLNEAQGHEDGGCEVSPLSGCPNHPYRYDYDCQITFTTPSWKDDE